MTTVWHDVEVQSLLSGLCSRQKPRPPAPPLLPVLPGPGGEPAPRGAGGNPLRRDLLPHL
jgi:hypothetical protein